MLGIVSQSPFSTISPHDVLEQLFLCLRLDRGGSRCRASIVFVTILLLLVMLHKHISQDKRFSAESVAGRASHATAKGPAFAERVGEREGSMFDTRLWQGNRCLGKT